MSNLPRLTSQIHIKQKNPFLNPKYQQAVWCTSTSSNLKNCLLLLKDTIFFHKLFRSILTGNTIKTDLLNLCMELCNIILFTTAGFTLSYARYGKPRNGYDVMQLHARIWKGLFHLKKKMPLTSPCCDFIKPSNFLKALTLSEVLTVAIAKTSRSNLYQAANHPL